MAKQRVADTTQKISLFQKKDDNDNTHWSLCTKRPNNVDTLDDQIQYFNSMQRVRCKLS